MELLRLEYACTMETTWTLGSGLDIGFRIDYAKFGSA